MESIQIKFIIGRDPPKRLDKALFRDAPEDLQLSRTRLARLIEAGMVKVQGQVERNISSRVASGYAIVIILKKAAEIDTSPEAIPLDIIYEDSDLVVVNKSAGMVVHPAPGSPSGTLVNALLSHCRNSLSGIGGDKRPGIVHRIDKDTSGLLVVAKNDKAHHSLAQQFKDHSVERSYLALCHGVPNVGEPRLQGMRGISFEQGAVVKITTQLARHKWERQRQAVIFEGGRRAVSRIKVLKRFGQTNAMSLISCSLETGRTHQIRAHLAHIGHGLVGDQIYGRAKKPSKNLLSMAAYASIKSFPRQALHASVLGFEHPISGKRMHFKAELPADIVELLHQLDKSFT